MDHGQDVVKEFSEIRNASLPLQAYSTSPNLPRWFYPPSFPLPILSSPLSFTIHLLPRFYSSTLSFVSHMTPTASLPLSLFSVASRETQRTLVEPSGARPPDGLWGVFG